MDTVCNICGSSHDTNNCNKMEIKYHIVDTYVPSRARLSLPKSLKIETMADGTPVVVAKCFIEKGTKFGPFVAKRILTLNPSIPFPIKVFTDDSEDFSEYYLNTTDENECNWMIFVTTAECIEEQNLICYQDKQDIYYVSLKDIKIGEHLKVWYSTHYAARVKAKPLTSKKTLEDEKTLNTLELSKLITKQQNIMQRDNWSCKFCGIVESNVVKFSTHILEHYVLQLKKVCEICRETFATRKGLKKHLKIVHCGSDQISKTSSKENDIAIETSGRREYIGGPLLNDMLTDSLDNSNIMLQQTEMSNFDLVDQNMLIESDNLSVDNILNGNVKELEHFNFEIDETEERFVCDVCLKAFNKLRLLVQHLKKHTAKYVCLKCTKIFCRNENLKSHICNNPVGVECSFCKKVFTQKKYLKHHVEVKHSNKFSCTVCGKTFSSNKEKNEHSCGTTVDKQSFSCITCSKVFCKESYLKRHMKMHSSLPSKANDIRFVCEVCGKQFNERRTLIQHTITHQDRSFECGICGKKFGRQEVLNNHILTHSVPQFKCEHCEKTFKLKKNLKGHLQLHNKSQIYKCVECLKIFHNKSNMLKHKKHVHNKICNVCGKTFSSAELREAHAVEHLNSYYACQFCKKIVKFRNSLVKHLKKQHAADVANMDFRKIKAVTNGKNNESELNLVDFEQGLLTDNAQGLTLPPNTYMVQNRSTTVLYVFDQFSKV